MVKKSAEDVVDDMICVKEENPGSTVVSVVDIAGGGWGASRRLCLTRHLKLHNMSVLQAVSPRDPS